MVMAHAQGRRTQPIVLLIAVCSGEGTRREKKKGEEKGEGRRE